MNRDEVQPTYVASSSVRPSRAKSVMVWIFVLLVTAGLSAVGWKVFSGHDKGDGKAAADRGKNKIAPVNVAVAKMVSVPIEIRSIGNVLAYSIVNVSPQVSGQLTEVKFTQGQMVKKGDLLFQIDPRPTQAALDQALGNVQKDRGQIDAAIANMDKDRAMVGQAEAQLSKDIAQSKYAEVEKERYSSLFDQGVVSSEQTDQMTTNSRTAAATIEADRKMIENAKAIVRSDAAAIATAKGTLAADQAAVATARIQLGFTKIYSPIDGRTSSLSVYQGNVVAPGTNLVSISQVTPIYVTVAIPEQYLEGVRHSQANNSLKMQALIEGVKTASVTGKITFIENTVNTTTGTVMLRAVFSNSDQRLYPGQFVDVILTMPPDGPSIMVPARAIQATQQGESVWVIRDKQAFLTPVALLHTSGEMAALKSGVKEGDIVVTDGQMQLTPGCTVSIEQTGTGSGDSNSNGRSESEDQFGQPSAGSQSTEANVGGDSVVSPSGTVKNNDVRKLGSGHHRHN